MSNTIWVDQICIDQSSTQERNHQVRLMSKVYTQASEVLIWLGNEANNSHKGKKKLKLSHRGVMTSLLSRQYWGRLWIVQEVFLAKSLTLMCGKQTITWQELSNHVRRHGFDALRRESEINSHSISCALNLIHLRLFLVPNHAPPANQACRGVPFERMR